MADSRPLPVLDEPGRYDSRTEARQHTTAARIDKQYLHDFPRSDNPDKSPQRADDGYVTSAEVARRAESLRRRAAAAGVRQTVDIEFHHPLEDILGRRPMRWLLGYISRRRRSGKTMLEEVIESYRNPAAPFWQRLKYWPLHAFIDRMRGGVAPEVFRKRVAEHVSTLRGLVVTARSVAEFGLTIPQRFSGPLFSVWNFTNRCNLQCRHCYQDSGPHNGLSDELTLEEKLDLVDQMAEQYIPMIAFAGGEPTVSRDLLPVLRRCQQYGIHTTIATNGTTMTPRLASELAEAGVRYVEISLDSVHPEKHDAFRGQPGMWQRTVRGMKCVVAQEGLRLGIAMCVHQGNYDEVEDMLRFACEMGASCLAHFNFIPVGRGLEMAGQDLSPRQREKLLNTLNEWMQSGRIGVISTAPQLGRVCMAHAPAEGLQSCSHAGAGGGVKARVVAKYLGGCGAGRTYICIEPNGDITPCVYLPHRLLGNIRQRRFVDIFRRNEFWEVLCDRDWRSGHCEVCTFKNYCGGCRARADAYYGELNGPDPGCIFNEKHWQRIVEQARATQPPRPQEAALQAVTSGAADRPPFQEGLTGGSEPANASRR